MKNFLKQNKAKNCVLISLWLEAKIRSEIVPYHGGGRRK
jgi:hypothetical protein